MEKQYYFAGQLIALSLIHCGTGPNFFSKTLFSPIASGLEYTEVNILDLTDPDLLEIVNVIRNNNNLNELKSILVDNPLTHIAGCTILQSLQDKEKLVSS